MPIVTVTGPSGAGKSSYAREIMKRRPEWALVRSVTTRPPREKDLPGEYEHADLSAFEAEKDGRLFYWTAEHHGHKYGTRLTDVVGALVGRQVRLMLVDPESIRSLQRLQTPGPDYIAHFYLLSPAEEVLRERLNRRKERDGLSDEEIGRRISECAAWDKEALASDIRYEFVPPEISIAAGADFIVRLIERR